MQDDSISPSEKARNAIELAFPEGIPGEESAEDVIDAIIWFYTCGRSDKERKLGADNENTDEEESYDTHERA